MRKPKLKILFLCTGNSCRSQMAEGFVRHLKGDVFEPYSAGVEPHNLDQNAVKVMAEIGIDISGNRSKHVDELKGVNFDYVITVCDHAHEHCPIFPGGTKLLHVGFDDPPRLVEARSRQEADPPRLTKNAKSPEEALDIYRRVRDEIRDLVKRLPRILDNPVH